MRIGVEEGAEEKTSCVGHWQIFLIYNHQELTKVLFFSPLSLYSFVVQLLSHVCLFTTAWTAAYQASLFFTISRSLLKLMAMESIMPSNHLIFCCLLLLLPTIFPSIRIFSNQSALCISIKRKSCSFLNGAKKKKKKSLKQANKSSQKSKLGSAIECGI